jgi:hypothetical protein
MATGELVSVAGGLTGLLSAAYVVYEKLTCKPKVKINLINNSIYIYEPSSSDKRYTYNFIFKLEVGNVGGELTTIVESELYIKEIDFKFECRFSEGFSITDNSKSCLVMAPGFAGSYKIQHGYKFDTRPDVKLFHGTYRCRLIHGDVIEKLVTFEIDKK